MVFTATDGYVFHVPEAYGQILVWFIIDNDGQQRTYKRATPNDQFYRADVPPAPLPDPPEPPEGWELVKPKQTRSGDLIVCYDPSNRVYEKIGSIEKAIEKGNFLRPEWIGASLAPGFAAYRRKRTGVVRLLPNNHFSKPLPLP